MAVKFTPMSAEKQWAIQQMHHDWAEEQIAAGVDGPVPPGRPDPSDWNQHVPDMEAPAAAQDQYFDRLREILAS